MMLDTVFNELMSEDDDDESEIESEDDEDELDVGDGDEEFDNELQPAMDHIIAALPMCTLTSADIRKLPEDKSACSICLDDFKAGSVVRTLPCLHSFHAGCVDKWLKRQGTCPNCKLEVNEDSLNFSCAPAAGRNNPGRRTRSMGNTGAAHIRGGARRQNSGMARPRPDTSGRRRNA
jgi:hypothetical protein